MEKISLSKEDFKDIGFNEADWEKARRFFYKQADKHNLLNKVCLYFGVKREDVKSPKRYKELVKARNVFCYLMFTHKDELCDSEMPLRVIGGIINRDHSTAVSAKKKFVRDYYIKKPFKESVDTFVKSFLGEDLLKSFYDKLPKKTEENAITKIIKFR